MPSTYTDSLRLEQQGIGENNNTWGNRLNTTIAAIDQAIAGAVEIALTTGTEVLESLNNDIDEARAKTLRFTGSLSGNVVVQAPAQAKEYLISDETTRNGFTIDVRLGTSGATVSIESAADFNVIFTDGTSWWRMVGDGAGEFRTNSQNDARFAQLTNNLSDLNSASTARTNLGLGTAAVEADTKYAHRANNLSDLANAATARSNLDVLQAGTAGAQARTNDQNDARFLLESNNLSDLNSASTARTNLGLGTAAVEADTKYAHRANNLSDLANAATARSNLGLGGAATQTYSETQVALGGGYDSGQDIRCVRIGNVVTITSVGSPSHSSTSAVISATGAVPSTFRPNNYVDNVYFFNVGAVSGSIRTVRIEADGTVETRYMDSDFQLISRTSAGTFSVSYCVNN